MTEIIDLVETWKAEKKNLNNKLKEYRKERHTLLITTTLAEIKMIRNKIRELDDILKMMGY